MSPQTNTPPTREGDPFTLDATEFPFADAHIVQLIASPTHLHWDLGGGGFYVETDRPLADHFKPAKLITGAGKQVKGFAADRLRFYPIAFRVRWEIGDPGNRIPVATYTEGARSRTTVLAVLEDGTWVKLTAGGLASKNLSQAVRDHSYSLARQLQAQPFTVPLLGTAGEAVQVKATMVTPFAFDPEEGARCPKELGWQIRERWDEVQAWRGPQTATPTPPSPLAANGSDSTRLQFYSNGELVAENPAEQAAFRAYVEAEGASPSDRDALRSWYLER